MDIWISVARSQLRLDQVPSIDKVIHTMIDVVSKGGNFLLTVAPDASGSIPST